MLRLIVIAVLLAVAVAWLEPAWDDGTRTFSVRVRDAREVGDWISSVAGPLNERYSELVGPDDPTPPVASGPPPRRPGESIGRRREVPQEQLTREEREDLDRLIEEKTRAR